MDMIGSTSVAPGCDGGINGGAGSSGPTSAIAARMTSFRDWRRPRPLGGAPVEPKKKSKRVDARAKEPV